MIWGANLVFLKASVDTLLLVSIGYEATLHRQLTIVRSWCGVRKRVRMVTSPDCIGLSVVISLLILAEWIPSRLVSM